MRCRRPTPCSPSSVARVPQSAATATLAKVTPSPGLRLSGYSQRWMGAAHHGWHRYRAGCASHGTCCRRQRDGNRRRLGAKVLRLVSKRRRCYNPWCQLQSRAEPPTDWRNHRASDEDHGSSVVCGGTCVPVRVHCKRHTNARAGTHAHSSTPTAPAYYGAIAGGRARRLGGRLPRG